MLLSWSATDWLAVLSGLAYVWLAARGKRICWVFGIISSSVIAWEDFLNLRLYSDGVLQIIYIIIGVWGWITWGKQELQHSIASKSWGFHMAVIGVSVMLTMPVAWFFSSWTRLIPPCAYLDPNRSQGQDLTPSPKGTVSVLFFSPWSIGPSLLVPCPRGRG